MKKIKKTTDFINIKNTNAITLIALIITIIILIILAGVAINLTIGENGIIDRAKQARIYKAEEIREKIAIGIQDIKLEKISEGKKCTLDDIIENLASKVNDLTIEKEENVAIGVCEGYNFTIDENLEIKVETNSNEKKKQTYSISLNLDENIESNNDIDKILEGKPYEITIQPKENYVIANVIAKMGTEDIEIDKETGTIHIENVSGNITITASTILKSAASEEFDFSGGEAEYIVPATGTYKLEVWGAQGGSYGSYHGGYGGYSVGEIELTVGQKLYVNVGGAGKNYGIVNKAYTGGYNGGGDVKTNNGDRNTPVITGGGLTHIALISGELYTHADEKDDIIDDILIVAGAGGAAGTNVAIGGVHGGNGRRIYRS